MKQRPSKLLLVFGGILLIVATALFFRAYLFARNTEPIVVAASQLEPYSAVKAGEIKYENVPQASVTANDLTQDEYEKTYQKRKLPLVVTARFLKGQRLDKREIARTAQESFAVVSPDESVVAVTTTLSGAAVGSIKPGDVVDVRAAGTANGGQDSTGGANYAKVLCIASQISGCSDVIPSGVSLQSTGQTASTKSTAPTNEQPVYVLLSVAKADARGLAGSTVALALNPFCTVDNHGVFRSVSKDHPCVVDSSSANREAAKAPTSVANPTAGGTKKALANGKNPVVSNGSPAVTTTGTTPTTTTGATGTNGG
jgi:Flp pilus assembly protein CpaB